MLPIAGGEAITIVGRDVKPRGHGIPYMIAGVGVGWGCGLGESYEAN